MDLNELNAHIRPIKIAHMKNSIKYRKLVKKILPLVDLPDVIYQIIFNYIGSSQFPQYVFGGGSVPIRLRFVRKNKKIFHPRALEETEYQGMESQESQESEPMKYQKLIPEQ